MPLTYIIYFYTTEKNGNLLFYYIKQQFQISKPTQNLQERPALPKTVGKNIKCLGRKHEQNIGSSKYEYSYY